MGCEFCLDYLVFGGWVYLFGVQHCWSFVGCVLEPLVFRCLVFWLCDSFWVFKFFRCLEKMVRSSGFGSGTKKHPAKKKASVKKSQSVKNSSGKEGSDQEENGEERRRLFGSL